jgi:hypothetical protein
MTTNSLLWVYVFFAPKLTAFVPIYIHTYVWFFSVVHNLSIQESSQNIVSTQESADNIISTTLK